MTDARNNATSYVYDNMDRVQTRTDPLLRSETYTYDSNGNLATFTDRKSQVTSRTYDALDRLTQLTYSDGLMTTYSWDAGNRVIQVIDSISGTITGSYDLLDRLTQETTPQGGVSYTYDAAGRRTNMTIAGQPMVTYGYDNANRLTSIMQSSQVVSLAYDIAGRRTTLTLPNGVTTEYAYDAVGRVTGLTYKNGTNTLGALTYAYDRNGSRSQIGGTWARSGMPQPLASATYDAANRQLTFGNQALTYDNNGNLTGDGTITYAWDARNRLGGLTGPGLVASFQYDGVGRRVGTMLNGTATSALHDLLNPIQETTGTTVRNILTGLGFDEFLSYSSTSGESNSLLAGALGSTIALVNSSGTVTTSYTYEPFGATTATGSPSENHFQFTGREHDSTGLYYYRARYYSPVLQRFISEDPAGFAGGINLYTYVHNRPVNDIDPLGLQPPPTPAPPPTNSQLGIPSVPGLPPGIVPSNSPGKFPGFGALLNMAQQLAAGPLLGQLSQTWADGLAAAADSIECGKIGTVWICYSTGGYSDIWRATKTAIASTTATIGDEWEPMGNPRTDHCFKRFVIGRRGCCFPPGK